MSENGETATKAKGTKRSKVFGKVGIGLDG